MKRRYFLVLAAAASICIVPSVSVAQSDFPSKAVRTVVASGPGGASDIVARFFQQAFDRIAPQPMIVQNMPGGGTSIGAREVALSDPDGHNLLMMHEGVVSAASQGIFDLGMQSLRPIASTGRDVYTVVVNASSPYYTLKDLYDGAASGDLKTAVNIGGLNHMTSLIVADAGEVTIRPVQTGSGADSVKALLGNQTDVIFTVPSDVTAYVESGDMRIIAVLDNERNEFLADVPTADEQGYPAISRLTHMWWAPKETADDRVEWLEGKLKEAIEDPSVIRALHERQISTVFMPGDELAVYLNETEELMSDFAERFGLKQK